MKTILTMKKCKNCREPFTPIRSTLEKYCQKDECLRVFVAEAKEKAWKKKKAIKKEELMTVSDWLKLAQQVFNKYIRLRDKNKPCISCNAEAGTYTLTAGHYIPSTSKNTTLDEINVNGQCWFNCNSSKSGNLIPYRQALVEMYGEQVVKDLEERGRKTRKYTIEELKEIISTYKQKIKNLE
jgi:hypothetical protein